MNKKYNLDFKLQIIEEYKVGPLGYNSLSKRFCCKEKNNVI